MRKISLTSSSKGLVILPETCYLKIDGENDDLKYELNQGVDIKTDENIKLACTVKNLSDSEISVNPFYETYINSSFGDKVETTTGNVDSVTIEPLSTKEFSVVLPKASTPNLYSMNLTLGNDAIKSNILNIFYIIRGSNAKINSFSLDKDYYNKGDTALISFTYFPSIDIFTRGRYPAVSATSILSKVEIKNDKDVLCAEPEVKDLINQTSIKVEFPTPIISKCLNPKVHVILTDESGNILDQKEFNIETTSISGLKPIHIIILILIILIIVLYFYLKNRRNTHLDDTNNNSSGINTFILLFLFGLSLFIPSNSAKANTITFENLLSSGNSYFVPYDVQNPSAGGTTVPITTTIPVVLTYRVWGDSDSGGKNYSSPGGIAQFQGQFYCNSFQNCIYYGLYLNVDVLENYNNNLLGPSYISQSTRDLWSWFNGGSPLRFSFTTDIFNMSTNINFNVYKDIPSSFKGVDKIHFLWMISKQETATKVTTKWWSDATIWVNPDGSQNTNVAYNPLLAEQDTINMIYPSTPSATVDVKVDTVDGPITKSTGDSVAVTWSTTNTTSKTQCTCQCQDKNGNAINCGNSGTTNCGNIDPKLNVGLRVISNPPIITNILQPTTFKVICDEGVITSPKPNISGTLPNTCGTAGVTGECRDYTTGDTSTLCSEVRFLTENKCNLEVRCRWLYCPL